MTRQAFTTFISVLALGANVLTIAGIGLLIAARRPGRAAVVAGQLKAPALWAAVFVTAAATMSSLALSEHFNMLPCRLCWFQRVFMYPLPILGAVLLACKERRAARLAVFSLAVPGSLMSVWHMLIEQFPNLEGGSCDPLNPCSAIWYRTFGFVGIPYGAFSCFLFAVVAALVAGRPAQLDAD